MAKPVSDRMAKKVVKPEKKKIELKRRITGDARWVPAKGAGMMPEQEWKKYQPDSKRLIDYIEEDTVDSPERGVE